MCLCGGCPFHRCAVPAVQRQLLHRYTDGNLDEQLVDTMRQFCVRVIEQQGEMSLDAITSLVRAKFTSEQSLSSGHMKQILQTLMYDGLVRSPDTGTDCCLFDQPHCVQTAFLVVVAVGTVMCMRALYVVVLATVLFTSLQ